MIWSLSRVYGLTAFAAVLYLLLGWLFADDFFFGPFFNAEYLTEGTWLTWLLLALIIVAGMLEARRVGKDEIVLQAEEALHTDGQVHDPNLWRLAMGNVHLSVLWLPIRFFVGREWLVAGEHKIRDDAWMDGGQALMDFLTGATTINEETGASRVTFTWYHDFLQTILDNEWYTWLARFVAVGEFLIGLGLVTGALVGIAAFFGTLMNFNFMLAGTTSTNPVLFGLAVFLVLAWKVAGHWGLERWLLPALGTPWQRTPVDRADADMPPAARR